MESAEQHAKEIIDIIKDKDNILVTVHANPDGDALGCASGMAWILKSMGKKFAIINRDPIPSHFQWVKMPCKWVTAYGDIPFIPSLLIILDCGDYWRVGKELSEQLEKIPSINIDHHFANPNFATLHNWVDGKMAAAGMMLEYLADVAEIPLKDELAESIYLSIVSDTGSFAHGNTSSEVFRLASRLLQNGFDASAWRSIYDNQWTMQKMILWGALTKKIKLLKSGAVSMCTVSLRDLSEIGAVKEDLDGFVEQIRKIRGVRVSVLMRELPDGGIKCSFRSCRNDDVSLVAQNFGGGGHKNAAAAVLSPLALDVAEKLVCESIENNILKCDMSDQRF